MNLEDALVKICTDERWKRCITDRFFLRAVLSDLCCGCYTDVNSAHIYSKVLKEVDLLGTALKNDEGRALNLLNGQFCNVSGITKEEYETCVNVTVEAVKKCEKRIQEEGSNKNAYCNQQKKKRGHRKHKEFIIKDGVLIKYIGKRRNINIPSGVRVIASHAFGQEVSVSEVTFHNKLKKICTEAFYYCPNLVKISLCNGKIKIEECAFFHCENLREAYLVHSLRVYQYAFYGCKNLTIFCNANIRPVKWSKKFNWINRSFLLFYKKKCSVIWSDDSI